MAVPIMLFLAVLAILPGHTLDPQIDVAMVQRMQQREEFLHQEMSRLCREVERSALEKAFLQSVFHWFFWAAVVAVLLEFCTQKQLGPSSCPEQDNCGSEGEGDEGLNGAQNAATSLAWPTLLPVKELPELSRNLKQLLGDFLINRDFSQGALMPKISPHL